MRSLAPGFQKVWNVGNNVPGQKSFIRQSVRKFSDNLSNDYDILDKLSNDEYILDKLSNDYDKLDKLSNDCHLLDKLSNDWGKIGKKNIKTCMFIVFCQNYNICAPSDNFGWEKHCSRTILLFWNPAQPPQAPTGSLCQITNP